METLTRADLPTSGTCKYDFLKTLTYLELTLAFPRQAPGECDTIVAVDFSTLNYKDAMVVNNKYARLTKT